MTAPLNSSLSAPLNAAEQLRAILTPGELLAASPDGDLLLDGMPARDLLAQFGSPLYVIVEGTLRRNYRAVRDAFAASWPAPVNVMYAIKANNNLAVRAVIHQEGGGGDCFGLGELRATFAGGADPAKVAMNGSHKTPAELEEAIRLGVTVNLDGEDEADAVEGVARALGVRARVNLRLKVLPEALRHVGSDYMGVAPEAGMLDRMAASKWGFGEEKAAEIARRLANQSHVHHVGWSWHLGRFSTDLGAVRAVFAELAATVRRLQAETGFWPEVLDTGGGVPRLREPETRGRALSGIGVDAYAAAACGALREGLTPEGKPLPALWTEPGRYIVGNAGVLLASVQTVKRDLGRTWVNVDASTNLLMRADTSGSQYHVLPASFMHRPFEEEGMVVGTTCIPSVLSRGQRLPRLVPGDAVAILDAGMYAEAVATQFNAVPRPATVMVNSGLAEIIRERETLEDVFRLHRLPERLRAAEPA